MFANFFIVMAFEKKILGFIKLILVFLFISATGMAWCQKQLILLNREDVILRLYPGDEIVYRLKGSKSTKTTYVNNLSDTSVVTHRDTVPFHTIERIYFHQPKFYNKVGTFLVIFGGGLFLIDQINTVLVQGNEPSLDDRLSATSLTSLAVGMPLMLIKKKFQKINYRHRLRMVEKDSFFYRPDTRENIEN